MLIAHKVIDALNRDKSYKVLLPPRYSVSPELVESIKNAQKFDFGVLPLQPSDDGPGHWEMPQLSSDEFEFWNERLIPLPYKECWFEFVLGDSRSALLVMEEANGWAVIRVDYCKDNVVSFDGFISSREYHSDQTELMGDENWLRTSPKEVIGSATCSIYLAIYMALMLNSRTTETAIETPSPKLNKARVKRGRSPLSTHLVVTLVPSRFSERANGQGGTHASPRLHWRRTHKRHFERPVPSAKWVEKEVHKGRIGWYVAIVPRCLVGLAELGEVSHEYFVPLDTRKPQPVSA